MANPSNPSKLFQGVHALIVFTNKEDERAVLDLLRIQDDSTGGEEKRRKEPLHQEEVVP
jgi:hypothetical protein